MGTVGIVCILLVVATTMIHYEVLRGLSLGLPRLGIRSRARLIVVILATFGAHAMQILLYGIAIFCLVQRTGIGALSAAVPASLSNCVYLSAETFTSLGYGDILLTGPLRLLAGAEALNGLLLIGWSASYTYLSMERFWGNGNDSGSGTDSGNLGPAGKSRRTQSSAVR